MSVDEPRLLHRTRGYTSNPLAALPAEPEAISADVEQAIAAAAERDRQQLLAAEWHKTRDRVLSSLDHFEEVSHPPARLLRGTRMLRRGVAAVDRDLGGA